MFEIRELDHINIVVKDVEASMQFYCDVLGMEERPRPADLRKAGAWLHKNSAQIHLLREDFATHAPGDLSAGVAGVTGADLGSSRHFSLVVDSIKELVKRLEEFGIPIAHGPVQRFGGLVQTYCYDPDGHLIEFTQLP